MSVYRFAPGIRLRESDCGKAMLLVPEGIVNLSDTASATLACVDGTRDDVAIARELATKYDAPETALLADVRDLLDALATRGYLVGAA